MIASPQTGDHKGPPNPSSTTLAPTDCPTSCLTSRLRLMPMGYPSSTNRTKISNTLNNLHLKLSSRAVAEIK